MNLKKKQFTSDNYSGICPEALDSLIKANEGHTLPYGEDVWTEEVCDMFREVFETDCEVFFVYNGTAANSLALASLTQSYHSVICSDTAHIETDECGAPEFFSNGAKLLLGDTIDGKLTPAGIQNLITKRSDIHYPKPRVVSITQATENGTVYSKQEILDIYKTTKRYGLSFHMDGARFANAVAALNVTPKEISWQTGIDVLCFGGTKNGLITGETVIFFNKAYADEFAYRCKQAGQLASKMRFISAPWIGLLKNGIWLKYATHANEMAAYLEQQLESIEKISVKFPCQANSLFIDIPDGVVEKLELQGWRFYSFIGLGGIRIMCSWDTQKEDVDLLVHDIKNALS